jgi:hypothetical protein
MKKLLILFALSVTSAFLSLGNVAYAQEDNRIVTGEITLLSPSRVSVLDEFISDQLYTGKSVFLGYNLNLRSMYKRQENLSWDLYYTTFNRSKTVEESGEVSRLSNPANSQYLKYTLHNIGYGTYYHWQFGEKLKIKAGGVFDLYGAIKNSYPDGVNNAMNLEGQIMVKAKGAIKYGWDFKNWGLDIHANVSIPVIGIMTADHPSEPAQTILFKKDHQVMKPAYRHLFLASYHNYMSLDYELGIDFVLKPLTITLGHGSINKWWNVYDLQNIRKIGFTTLGLSFDIAPLNKFKSSNKNF